ncbi:hypothetical protein H9P43_001685 [Blastocladiella emersonii ATCC 22665]|nr:hypothetical protein H9P43_001685 [Blastocladiella emersonii ATCC 22665]
MSGNSTTTTTTTTAAPTGTISLSGSSAPQQPTQTHAGYLPHFLPGAPAPVPTTPRAQTVDAAAAPQQQQQQQQQHEPRAMPPLTFSFGAPASAATRELNHAPAVAQYSTAAQYYSFLTSPSLAGSYGSPSLSAGAGTGNYTTSSSSAQHHHGHSQRYRAKVVCMLNCKYCGTLVCHRGMKAILLADAGVELFSTDSPPATIAMFGDDYTTEKCQCRIRDVACLCCGNQVGYSVTQPCKACLSSSHNGHVYMLHMEHVQYAERLDVHTNGRPLSWATIPAAEKDDFMSTRFEDTCR